MCVEQRVFARKMSGDDVHRQCSRYGDGVDNTIKENSSIFSLIQMSKGMQEVNFIGFIISSDILHLYILYIIQAFV